ncbi:ciliary microtubule inner protein 7 isoform 2-T2 [Anomaloglossus baeobatrachus]|uniref:ciliary microtubule inner protein 7 isoform X2 n=1 Tax=Anomaloglossus baeobatrachus TaxID=238106 RepID=UPI003F4FA973
MPEAITGSWFPSGFHGHSRSHIRNDIYQEYRMEAKPPPPKAFTQRIRGLGKKKLLKYRESYNFTHWTPLDAELKRQRPLISTYQTDFWRKDGETGKVVPQILVPRVSRATSASCSGLTTTYRHMLRSCGDLQASQNSITTDITLISNKTRAGTSGVSLLRAMSAPYKRLTVSDCLVWHSPDNVKTESAQSTDPS